jgi:cell volume regulation protein A
MYGVEIKGFDPALTLSDCFARASRGHPVVGDRLDLGSLLLVVREVAGDRVVKVGLKMSR